MVAAYFQTNTKSMFLFKKHFWHPTCDLSVARDPTENLLQSKVRYEEHHCRHTQHGFKYTEPSLPVALTRYTKTNGVKSRAAAASIIQTWHQNNDQAFLLPINNLHSQPQANTATIQLFLVVLTSHEGRPCVMTIQSLSVIIYIRVTPSQRPPLGELCLKASNQGSNH